MCESLDLDELSRRSGLEFETPGGTGKPGGDETCALSSSDGGGIVFIDVTAEQVELKKAFPSSLRGVELEDSTVVGQPVLTGSTVSNGVWVAGIASQVGERTMSITATDVSRKPREEALKETMLAAAEMVIAAG